MLYLSLKSERYHTFKIQYIGLFPYKSNSIEFQSLKKVLTVHCFPFQKFHPQ